MTDDVVRLSELGRVVRRRWRALLAFAAAGALLGAVGSWLFSPGYETSSSVLLQGPRTQDELLTEAQIAMSSVVLDRTAAALGWDGVTGPDLRDEVHADVADGNLIMISGTADTAERAQLLTDRAIQEYVTFSTQLISNPSDASSQVLQERQEALRQLVASTGKKIDELAEKAADGTVAADGVQVRTKLEALRSDLSDAIIRLDEAETASSRVGMVIMGKSELPATAAAPNMLHLVGGGILLGLVGGLFTLLLATRRDVLLVTEPTGPEAAAELAGATTGARA